jgi:hypothetical protein
MAIDANIGSQCHNDMFGPLSAVKFLGKSTARVSVRNIVGLGFLCAYCLPSKPEPISTPVLALAAPSLLTVPWPCRSVLTPLRLSEPTEEQQR